MMTPTLQASIYSSRIAGRVAASLAGDHRYWAVVPGREARDTLQELLKRADSTTRPQILATMDAMEAAGKGAIVAPFRAELLQTV